LGQARLEAIDRPYRVILDAAERNSAKNTFVVAAKSARAELVTARSAVLIATPIQQRTADSPPAFVTLAADGAMQAILERRWLECKRCIDASAPLAATVMMGGLLEALLVSRANKLSDKSKLFKAAATPIDPKTKKPLDLRQWTLGQLLVREFWLPFALASAWTGYALITDPFPVDFKSLIKTFGPAFFFVSWATRTVHSSEKTKPC
jgi:hypothetical protein